MRIASPREFLRLAEEQAEGDDYALQPAMLSGALPRIALIPEFQVSCPYCGSSEKIGYIIKSIF